MSHQWQLLVTSGRGWGYILLLGDKTFFPWPNADLCGCGIASFRTRKHRDGAKLHPRFYHSINLSLFFSVSFHLIQLLPICNSVLFLSLQTQIQILISLMLVAKHPITSAAPGLGSLWRKCCSEGNMYCHKASGIHKSIRPMSISICHPTFGVMCVNNMS